MMIKKSNKKFTGRRLISALLALILLLNAPASAWAVRPGNYGEKSSMDMFVSGTLSGTLTAISCIANPGAGLAGSVASDLTGYIMFYYYYEDYGKPMFKIGNITITRGQFMSMAAGITAGAFANYTGFGDKVINSVQDVLGVSEGTKAASVGSFSSWISNIPIVGQVFQVLQEVLRPLIEIINGLLRPIKEFIHKMIESLRKWLRKVVKFNKFTSAPVRNSYARLGAQKALDAAIVQLLGDLTIGTVKLIAAEAIKQKLEDAGVDETIASVASSLSSYFLAFITPVIRIAYGDAAKKLGVRYFKKEGVHLDNTSGYLNQSEYDLLKQAEEIGNQKITLTDTSTTAKEQKTTTLGNIASQPVRVIGSEGKQENLTDLKTGDPITLQEAAERGLLQDNGQDIMVRIDGKDVRVSAAEVASKILGQLRDYSDILASEPYTTLSPSTGGLPHDIKGRLLMDGKRSIWQVGFESMRTLGLAPLFSTFAKIAALELMKYRTEYGDDKGNTKDNAIKMAIAGLAGDLIGVAVNNWDSLNAQYAGTVREIPHTDENGDSKSMKIYENPWRTWPKAVKAKAVGQAENSTKHLPGWVTPAVVVGIGFYLSKHSNDGLAGVLAADVGISALAAGIGAKAHDKPVLDSAILGAASGLIMFAAKDYIARNINSLGSGILGKAVHAAGVSMRDNLAAGHDPFSRYEIDFGPVLIGINLKRDTDANGQPVGKKTDYALLPMPTVAILLNLFSGNKFSLIDTLKTGNVVFHGKTGVSNFAGITKANVITIDSNYQGDTTALLIHENTHVLQYSETGLLGKVLLNLVKSRALSRPGARIRFDRDIGNIASAIAGGTVSPSYRKSADVHDDSLIEQEPMLWERSSGHSSSGLGTALLGAGLGYGLIAGISSGLSSDNSAWRNFAMYATKGLVGAASEIGWVYYCYKNDIEPGAAAELGHLAVASLTSGLVDTFFRRNPFIAKLYANKENLPEAKLILSNGNEVQLALAKAEDLTSAVSLKIGDKILDINSRQDTHLLALWQSNPNDDIFAQGQLGWNSKSVKRFLFSVGEDLNNRLTQAALQSAIFGYPYFSPGTGFAGPAFLAQQNEQDKMINHIAGMMQGASPTALRAGRMAQSMRGEANEAIAESVSKSIINPFVKHKDPSYANFIPSPVMLGEMIKLAQAELNKNQKNIEQVSKRQQIVEDLAKATAAGNSNKINELKEQLSDIDDICYAAARQLRLQFNTPEEAGEWIKSNMPAIIGQLEKQGEELVAEISNFETSKSIMGATGWMPIVGAITQNAVRDRIGKDSLHLGGIITYTVDSQYNIGRYNSYTLKAIINTIANDPHRAGLSQKQLDALNSELDTIIKENKDKGSLINTYDYAIAGAYQGRLTYGNSPLLSAGTLTYLSRIVGKGDIEGQSLVAPLAPDPNDTKITPEEREKISKKIDKKIADIKALRESNPEVTSLTWIPGDTHATREDVIIAIKELAAGIRLSHPQYGLLGRTEVDRFARAQVSYEYLPELGIEGNVRQDKETRYYYGPFGLAGTKTIDWTQIGLQEWQKEPNSARVSIGKIPNLILSEDMKQILSAGADIQQIKEQINGLRDRIKHETGITVELPDISRNKDLVSLKNILASIVDAAGDIDRGVLDNVKNQYLYLADTLAAAGALPSDYKKDAIQNATTRGELNTAIEALRKASQGKMVWEERELGLTSDTVSINESGHGPINFSSDVNSFRQQDVYRPQSTGPNINYTANLYVPEEKNPYTGPAYQLRATHLQSGPALVHNFGHKVPANLILGQLVQLLTKGQATQLLQKIGLSQEKINIFVAGVPKGSSQDNIETYILANEEVKSLIQQAQERVVNEASRDISDIIQVQSAESSDLTLRKLSERGVVVPKDSPLLRDRTLLLPKWDLTAEYVLPSPKPELVTTVETFTTKIGPSAIHIQLQPAPKIAKPVTIYHFQGIDVVGGDVERRGQVYTVQGDPLATYRYLTDPSHNSSPEVELFMRHPETGTLISMGKRKFTFDPKTGKHYLVALNGKGKRIAVETPLPHVNFAMQQFMGEDYAISNATKQEMRNNPEIVTAFRDALLSGNRLSAEQKARLLKGIKRVFSGTPEQYIENRSTEIVRKLRSYTGRGGLPITHSSFAFSLEHAQDILKAWARLPETKRKALINLWWNADSRPDAPIKELMAKVLDLKPEEPHPQALRGENLNINTGNLTDGQLMYFRQHILPHFGYNANDPKSEAFAWENYGLAIAAKTAGLSENEQVRAHKGNSIKQGSEVIGIDPAHFTKIGVLSEKALANSGLSNPHEASVLLRAGVFAVPQEQQQVPVASQISTTQTGDVSPALAAVASNNIIEPQVRATSVKNYYYNQGAVESILQRAFSQAGKLGNEFLQDNLEKVAIGQVGGLTLVSDGDEATAVGALYSGQTSLSLPFGLSHKFDRYGSQDLIAKTDIEEFQPNAKFGKMTYALPSKTQSGEPGGPAVGDAKIPDRKDDPLVGSGITDPSSVTSVVRDSNAQLTKYEAPSRISKPKPQIWRDIWKSDAQGRRYHIINDKVFSRDGKLVGHVSEGFHPWVKAIKQPVASASKVHPAVLVSTQPARPVTKPVTTPTILIAPPAVIRVNGGSLYLQGKNSDGSFNYSSASGKNFVARQPLANGGFKWVHPVGQPSTNSQQPAAIKQSSVVPKPKPKPVVNTPIASKPAVQPVSVVPTSRVQPTTPAAKTPAAPQTTTIKPRTVDYITSTGIHVYRTDLGNGRVLVKSYDKQGKPYSKPHLEDRNSRTNIAKLGKPSAPAQKPAPKPVVQPATPAAKKPVITPTPKVQPQQIILAPMASQPGRVYVNNNTTYNNKPSVRKAIYDSSDRTITVTDYYQDHSGSETRILKPGDKYYRNYAKAIGVKQGTPNTKVQQAPIVQPAPARPAATPAIKPAAKTPAAPQTTTIKPRTVDYITSTGIHVYRTDLGNGRVLVKSYDKQGKPYSKPHLEDRNSRTNIAKLGKPSAPAQKPAPNPVVQPATPAAKPASSQAPVKVIKNQYGTFRRAGSDDSIWIGKDGKLLSGSHPYIIGNADRGRPQVIDFISEKDRRNERIVRRIFWPISDAGKIEVDIYDCSQKNWPRVSHEVIGPENPRFRKYDYMLVKKVPDPAPQSIHSLPESTALRGRNRYVTVNGELKHIIDNRVYNMTGAFEGMTTDDNLGILSGKDVHNPPVPDTAKIRNGSFLSKLLGGGRELRAAYLEGNDNRNIDFARDFRINGPLPDSSVGMQEVVNETNGEKVTVRVSVTTKVKKFFEDLSQSQIAYVNAHSRLGTGMQGMNDARITKINAGDPGNPKGLLDYSDGHSNDGLLASTYMGESLRYGRIKPEDVVSRGSKRYVKINNNALLKAPRYPGEQFIIVYSCDSKKHFADDFRAYRGNLPTTIIFTDATPNTSYAQLNQVIGGLFTNKSAEEIAQEMNQVLPTARFTVVRFGYGKTK